MLMAIKETSVQLILNKTVQKVNGDFGKQSAVLDQGDQALNIVLY